MREPLLIPLFFLIAGILAAHTLDLSVWDCCWPLFGFLLLAAVSSWQRNEFLKRTCVFLAVFFGGCLTDAWHRPGPSPEIDASSREIVTLEGCVVEPSALAPDREQFTLEIAPHARARVTIPSPAKVETQTSVPLLPRFHYGQRVEFDARIRRPQNFLNPGSFDYVRYLARRDIYWTATVSANTSPTTLAGRCGSRFHKLLFDIREAALDRLEKAYPKDEYASGMMQAILLGENAKLERIWTENFRKTGTIHALVISGTHVAVLAFVLLLILHWCGVPAVPALLITALAAWLYAAVSGFSPPVIRAAGGFTFVLAARLVFRKGRILNLLAALAMVYLLFDPSALSDASFQLSFLAAAALGGLAVPLLEASSAPYQRGLRRIANPELDVHLEPKIAQLRVEIRLAAEAIFSSIFTPRTGFRLIQIFIATGLRGLLFLLQLLLVSTVMQVALALPMVEYFHRVSFTGISANLLVVPLLELTVPLGFLTIFTGSKLVASVALMPLRGAAAVVNWHSRIEPAWRIASPPIWVSASILLALLLTIVSIRFARNRAYAFALLSSSFGLLLWQPWQPQTEPGTLELSVIDVGQGDSILVVFPDGRTMLVDGGGFLRYGRKETKSRLDTGEDVVAPYLWSRGIRRLDIVAVTHAHEDHEGGIPSLVEEFRPKEVWFGANPSDSLLQNLLEIGIPALEPKGGSSFEFGSTRVEVLAPLKEMAFPKAGNNDSLVLRLTYKDRSFLLTGDIERPVEDYLWAKGILRKADVLKVGHHGSKTSSSEEFLGAVRPSIAAISVGANNSFGHPHPVVVERLQGQQAAILRTDRDGLITIRTDGHKLFFSNALWENASKAVGFELVGPGRGWGQILVH